MVDLDELQARFAQLTPLQRQRLASALSAKTIDVEEIDWNDVLSSLESEAVFLRAFDSWLPGLSTKALEALDAFVASRPSVTIAQMEQVSGQAFPMHLLEPIERSDSGI